KTGGAGLMFVTLPKVFEAMPLGQFIGAAFFVLVLFAALTSSISLMEAITSIFMDKFKMKRVPAVVLVTVISILLGVPSSLGHGAWANITILGMDFLTFFDFISNSVIMPIVALLTCILIGWFVGTKTVEDEVTVNGEKFTRVKIFRVMTKYIAPVCLVVILVFYTLVQFGVIAY
ncbi:MAG: sodium-dependent transporter, partial [Lachnospiraceae bacterium]|nr:sodium-dependent transporter [Lachnospiraceae bacterium]